MTDLRALLAGVHALALDAALAAFDAAVEEATRS